jgi:heavy metal sensor kinase
MMLESVRARLALWHAATLAVLLIAFAVVAYVYTERTTLHRTDEHLRDSAGAFAAELRAEAEEMPDLASAAREAVDAFRFGSLRVVVWTASLRPLALSPPPPVHPEAEPTPPFDPLALAAAYRRHAPGGSAYLTVMDSEGGYRAYVRPVRLGDESLLVAVAQGQHGRREALEEARVVLLVSIPLVLLLAWAGGYLLARRSLAPVVVMSERAARLGASELDQALPVQNPRDELGQLAVAFNGLLMRLSGAIRQQRDFMADASHELRTPVAILLGETDLALSVANRSPDEYRDSLRVVNAEARRLSRVVSDLFLLARVDAGQQPLHPGELYLDELAADCVRSLRSLATGRGVELTFQPDGEFPFRGDEPLLHRLLLNLLDNALKYSPSGGSVSLEIAHAPGGYRLAVCDGAPPIPPDARERIFERFYRVDRSRSRATESATGGAGLGLPIARWVAQVHGGTLELASSPCPPGNRFEVFLPYPSPLPMPGVR